mgnify:CR=1 FL=1
MRTLKTRISTYFVIKRLMGHSALADQLAALIAFFLTLRKGSLRVERRLAELIEGNRVSVVLATEEAEKKIRELDEWREVIIAADKATRALLKEGVVPRVIVTDLDGYPSDLILLDRIGSILVVHAHGDNILQLIKLTPKLKNVIPTTQVLPLAWVRNYGGYTDGDRGAFLALHFNAGEVKVLGLPEESPKRLKFRIGMALLRYLKGIEPSRVRLS